MAFASYRGFVLDCETENKFIITNIKHFRKKEKIIIALGYNFAFRKLLIEYE
jgi:hypothetical protein